MSDEHPSRRQDPDWGPTTEHRTAADPRAGGGARTTGAHRAVGEDGTTPAGDPASGNPPAGDPAAGGTPATGGPATGDPAGAPTTTLPGLPPAPPRSTDELPLGRRFVRRVRRGEQAAAVKDAARTLEARLHPDFRVAIATGVAALAAAVVQQTLFPVTSSHSTTELIGYGLALTFLVLAVVAVRSLANESARLSAVRGGMTAAQTIRVAVLLVGYVLVGLVTLELLDVRLGNLLVGGAVTGVVIGIAAQQTLGNVFAGLVLLFSRPYVPGERIRVNAGALGGPHDGVVVSVGLTYTVLLTDYGPLNIPNSGLLGSAIGPQPPADADPAAAPGAATPPAAATPAAAVTPAAASAPAAGQAPAPTTADAPPTEPPDRPA